MSNPFVHIELSTDDLAKAKKFYKAVFDWDMADVPGMNYTMINQGKNATGGGMQSKPMPEAPTAWLPYVAVSDVKKSIADAEKAGAHVVVPYMEIGGGMGAFGIFVDPSGASLGVWEMAQQAKSAATRRPAKAKKAAKKTAKKAAKKTAKKAKKAKKAR